MENNLIDPNVGSKQKSWFHTDVDFENSFKFWFALQWQNKFLPIFLVTFIATIVELCKLGDIIDAIKNNFDDGVAGGIFTIMGSIIPPAISIIIAYKGFYQYFNDLKNGTSR